MKIKLHIPIEEVKGGNISMWSFADVDIEVASFEEAIEFYHTSKSLQNAPGEGLDKKTYDRAVCEYLNTGELVGGSELYQQMSLPQREWFQITKRAFKRLEK